MTDEKNKRPRSPNFPYSSLRDAITLVEKLYKKDKQNYVPMPIALGHMGLSTTSSTSRRIISAMLEYGLLEDRGDGNSKQLIVSDLARNIILDERPNSTERLQNIRKSALSSKMMREAWEKWMGNIPAEDTVKFILISQFDFTDRAASKFSKVIKDNFEFANLNDYYETDTPPEAEEITPETSVNPSSSGKIDQKPNSISTNPDWLNFNLSLGADQHARLLVSNSLSEDDFDFLLIWIKRLKNDIVGNNKEIETNDNDDIPF